MDAGFMEAEADGSADDAEATSFDGSPVLPDAAPIEDAAPVAPDEGLQPDGAVIERPLTPEGVLAPVGRVVQMAIPENPDAARRAGCLVHGASVGTGPYNLNLVAGGDIFERLRPDRTGDISLVLLFRALDWAAGVTANALDTMTLQFMAGHHSSADGFSADESEFVDSDPAGEAKIQFDEISLRAGWFEAGPTALSIPFAIFDSPIIPLALESVNLSGRVAADGPGLRIDHGVVTGYITLEAMVSVIVEIRALCETDASAAGCALIGGQLNRPNEELAALVLSILGNYDTRLEDGLAYACDPGEEGACNAVGLCLTYQVRGIDLAQVR